MEASQNQMKTLTATVVEVATYQRRGNTRWVLRVRHHIEGIVQQDTDILTVNAQDSTEEVCDTLALLHPGDTFSLQYQQYVDAHSALKVPVNLYERATAVRVGQAGLTHVA